MLWNVQNTVSSTLHNLKQNLTNGLIAIARTLNHLMQFQPANISINDHDINNGTMFTLPETLHFQSTSSYFTMQRLK